MASSLASTIAGRRLSESSPSTLNPAASAAGIKSAPILRPHATHLGGKATSPEDNNNSEGRTSIFKRKECRIAIAVAVAVLLIAAFGCWAYYARKGSKSKDSGGSGQRAPGPTSADIKGFVAKGKPIFVMYSAYGCEACAAAKPHFIQAAEQLPIASAIVDVSNVSADEQPEFIPYIFIQKADGERVHIPFTNMTDARRLVEHVGAHVDLAKAHASEALNE